MTGGGGTATKIALHRTLTARQQENRDRRARQFDPTRAEPPLHCKPKAVAIELNAVRGLGHLHAGTNDDGHVADPKTQTPPRRAAFGNHRREGFSKSVLSSALGRPG